MARTPSLSPDLTARAVQAWVKRIEDGKQTGGKRFVGMTPEQRKLETAKATYVTMKRKSTERAVARLVSTFGVSTAEALLDEWDDAGAKVFIG